MTKKIKCSFSYLMLALAAMFTYNFVTVIVFGVSELIEAKLSKGNFESFFVDTIAMIILLFFYFIWINTFSDRKISKENEPKILGKSITMALGFNGIASIWFIFVEFFLVKYVDIIKKSVESFSETWGSLEDESYIWVVLSVVIIGPIVEEILFRGIVFHYLERIRGGFFPIIFSALFFGIWHGEIVQIVYTSIIGVGLGIIYHKTRNLKMPILVHMLNNMLSTLPTFMDTEKVNSFITILAFFMIIPTIIILVSMIKTSDKKTKQ